MNKNTTKRKYCSKPATSTSTINSKTSGSSSSSSSSSSRNKRVNYPNQYDGDGIGCFGLFDFEDISASKIFAGGAGAGTGTGAGRSKKKAKTATATATIKNKSKGKPQYSLQQMNMQAVKSNSFTTSNFQSQSHQGRQINANAVTIPNSNNSSSHAPLVTSSTRNSNNCNAYKLTLNDIENKLIQRQKLLNSKSCKKQEGINKQKDIQNNTNSNTNSNIIKKSKNGNDNHSQGINSQQPNIQSFFHTKRIKHGNNDNYKHDDQDGNVNDHIHNIIIDDNSNIRNTCTTHTKIRPSFTTAKSELIIQSMQQEQQQQQQKQQLDQESSKSSSSSNNHKHILIKENMISSTDQIIMTSKKSFSQNIVSLLQNRTISSNQKHKLFQDGGYHGMNKHVHRQWNICDNITLETSSCSFDSNRNHSYEISTMQFDNEGILLAVGDRLGYIQIYDFDEVNAANVFAGSSTGDVGSTSDAERKKKNIKPFIMFRPGNGHFRISCIQWNPKNENLLVISFSNMNEIRVYDISSSSRNGPLFNTIVDINEKNNNCNNGNNTLTIIPCTNTGKKSRLIVGGYDGSLKLWEIPNTNIHKKDQNLGNLLWSINPCNETITEIIHLYSSASTCTSNPCNDSNTTDEKQPDDGGLIMIATAYGSFVLFDIHNCTRKSFSSSQTPQQLKMWQISNRHRGLQNHNLPTRDWMGVTKCYIQGIHKNKYVVSRETRMKLFIDICVCLHSGWVMTMNIDLSSRNNWWQLSGPPTFKVLHKPTNVDFYDSEGNEVMKMKPTVCVPEIPTPTASLSTSSSLVIIGKVNQIKITLPNSDKRVQGAQKVMTREDDCNRIIIVDHKHTLNNIEKKDPTFSLPIPKGKLKNIVVHPGCEWIILSYSKQGDASTQPALQLMKLQVRSQKE